MGINNIFKFVRKFAPSVEKAVYNMQTAPSKVKLNKSKDVLHLHWNDGPHGEKISNGIATAMRRFNEADHGTVARLGADAAEYSYGLSHDSTPLFFQLGNRWANQGKAKFVEIEGEPIMARLNTVPTKKTGKKPVWTQEYVDKLVDQVKAINELQGTNFPLPRLVQKEHPALAKFKNDSAQYNWMLKSLGVKPITFVEIPNIGLLKFKKGGRLVKRNKFSIK